MKTKTLYILVCILLFACKNEKENTNASKSINRFEKDWKLFQNAVINKAEFNWNNFVEIEGQIGQDYMYLFESKEAIEKIEKTSYSDLYDATMHEEPVKRLTIGVFDEFTRPEGTVFYFKETDRGLKLIGFESL